ncbi:FAD-dependent oxidoreductase [Corynebacterium uberis]|uniref:FAD-dependent oxidoreductase n=1 Tax=Corynebacterium TaxID=1716 RepID=UPI001D0AB1B1|nr:MULTISPECIES: FAD-dependent oxidoreductase [Corynebacterium]MCZ9309697.1 FAD-dependent oxidoreductase [Corynebacterium sp. c6VSa_13]UDL73501.1 FAD-dependent oxidoreductase [Corynebacterium uberis]UDL75619.1 FAD-dependent oxidoreductase [Corynebacterium uberis]UDL77832.1 FAD-dependent oxidoreductase [Corynebacterium uberis]UDL80115.1 FAD-dependent oxidoreductase [Corynebacterium uberis]
MSEQSRALRVAVVGAGPAGIYASDLLVKADQDVAVDLYERMPAPFGLIRYGVAPDHPRIKGIVTSLHRVLDKPEIRLLGNIDVGNDVTIEELADYYDAIVFSTGATGDRDLPIPGSDLPESYGAGQFVGFYDGNPDFTRDWNLAAESVAVVGVGNVGLDIARILAKTGDELHVTEIPDNVYEGLSGNAAKEVHIFGRRGPAQAKFTPMELKELDHSPTIEVIVDPEDIDYDAASEEARRASKSQDLVCQTLEQYAMREPKGAPHKLFIHFFESPVEILGENGHVVGFKTERTELDGNGGVRGTGKFTTWPVQAVYRAVGYRSDAVTGVPFDANKAVIPNDGGHVLSAPDGEIIPGLYTTGWIKRGPVGLIGNTKSDAKETTEMLLADFAAGKLDAPEADKDNREAVVEFLKSKGIAVTTWDGWHRLDAAERALGEAEGRERKKIVEWDEMVSHAGAEYEI